MKMKSRIASACPSYTCMPDDFSVSTLVGGISLIASSWPVFSAVTIASSSRKNWSPNPSMCGGVPYQFGLRLEQRDVVLAVLGEDERAAADERLAVRRARSRYVLMPLPSPVAYCSHTCCGRIGVIPTSDSAVAVGCA